VISVVSLVAVVVWIVRQPAPPLPSSATGFAWLALSLVMSLVALGLRGWRWHGIMRLASVDHRRSDAYGLTAVGYMGNNVLPARGGELLKIGILGARSTTRRREILGSVVAERLLDAVVLAVLFVVLSGLGLADSPASVTAVAIVGGAVLLGFAALSCYLWLRRRGRFESFAATVRPVARASKLFAHRGGAALAALSVVIWIVEGLNLVAIASSVGLSMSAPDGVLVVVLASLVAAVPAAPGYAGTFDAAMVLGLKAAGIVGGGAVGVLLLARFMFFVPATVVGLVLMLSRYGGLARRGAPRLGGPPAHDEELLAEQAPGQRGAQVAAGHGGAGR
jgi:uncharacterized membrane protein YbhN (UPF0104 family)